MLSLFPDQLPYPTGFCYRDEFISPQEEHLLLNEISTVALHTFVFQGYEAKRKVASFGYDYSFEKKTLQPSRQIPKQFDWLIHRVAQEAAIPSENFKELLITEYPVGSVINWHRDAFPFDLIAGISLQTPCTFKLRPHEKEKQIRKNTVTITLQPRSLYILKGEARHLWQHATAPVSHVRYSITLRTLHTTSTSVKHLEH